MFEYAISHNQRRKPTGRLFASAALSVLIHLLMLAVLIENPWILKGGVYQRFRGLIFYTDTSPDSIPDTEEDNYRLVAVLRPMVAPSDETLKKLLPDRDSDKKEGDDTSSRTRWGNDEKNAPDEEMRISSTIETKPKPAPIGNDEASDMENRVGDNTPVPEGTGGVPSSETAGVVAEPEKERESPPSIAESPPKEDIALNTAPVRIPETIPLPEESDTSDNLKVFENEQQAIDSGGSGIFGDLGYPLKEYASKIKKRVTEKWYIPSNLRGSKGHTTIVFFIDRNGQHFGTHIVDSSGNNSLDLTALNAILNSNPFPPLPQGFPGDHVGVKYVFIPQAQ